MDRQYEAIIDAEGHFDLPPEIRERYGLKQGVKVTVTDRASEIAVRLAAQESGSHRTAFEAIDRAVGMLGSDGSLLRALMQERQSEQERDNRAFGA